VKNPEIKIVGAGLLGTSLGLALARQSVVATLEDQSKANLRLAVEYGAGVEVGPEPDLVIVCVPPDLTADVVIDQLRKHPAATVTDVASVKSKVAQDVEQALPEQSHRYIGSHPMAGREKGGPSAARADLFFARPWIITPATKSTQDAVDLIRDVALRLGALPIELSSTEHDRAVALVSHLPQLVASLLANRLNLGTSEQLALAGQGLRDTSRIAASDPELWVQIISQNSDSIAPLISLLEADLAELAQAVSDIEKPGSLAKIHGLLQGGNAGVARIPGKHGGKSNNFQVVTVVIEDAPGALASLLTFIGEIGVNLEDLNLEHSPGAPIGLVELQVLPEVAARLGEQLVANGWRLV
jgi:prephenate dehydrogenase